MKCIMSSGVYLRANGRLNCWCGPGEAISLGLLPNAATGWDFVKDFYNGPQFQQIRASLRQGTLPHPGVCQKCAYFEPERSDIPQLTPTVIDMMHIEPAAICNLRCPYCLHGTPQGIPESMRQGGMRLPLELYRKVLEDIARAGMGIRQMYMSGKGEPTLNPDVWSMVEGAKNLFDTDFMVATNGNIKYHDMIIGSRLDKIKIAADNLDQKIYSAYRINGDISKLLKLTETIANEKIRAGVDHPKIVWQKVIFNNNTSQEEIREYERTAKAYGVNAIRYVTAFTKEYPDMTLDDFSFTFPEVELADGSARNHITPAALRKRLNDCAREDNLPGALQVVIDIMSWHGFGITTRAEEDEFYQHDLGDRALYLRRQENSQCREFNEVLAGAFGQLREMYERRGHSREAKLYSGWIAALRSVL